MEPHIQRVSDERSELNAKLTRLEDFIDFNPVFKSLRVIDRQLMRDQAAIMRIYSRILGERLTEMGVELN